MIAFNKSVSFAFVVTFMLADYPAFGQEPTDQPLPIQVSIEPRVELISVIYRLAGNREYSRGGVPSYIDEVDAHFGAHKNHAVVQFARQLRQTRGVSFDAPMSLAVHLHNPFNLEGRVPLDPLPANVDGRWRPDDAAEFVRLARAFVEDTNFESFITEHQALYDEVARRGEAFFGREVDLDWFENFFGERPGAEFHIVLSMINWPSNYGPRFKQNDHEELYSILGVGNPDADGIPVMNRDALGTVAHEFCHSFVNPLVYANVEELKTAGKRIYGHVRQTMQAMAYGNWSTMMHESLVRASVVRYMATTAGPQAAAQRIKQEEERGFIWTGELAALLETYEEQRETYSTLASFFPHVIDFFNTYSETVEETILARSAAAPKIVKIIPPNGAPNVDPGLRELRVTFDRPMGKGFSWVGGGPNFPTIPEGKRPRWIEDGKTCVLPVELKPNWQYQLWLNRGSFQSFVSRDTGAPLKPVSYSFGTSESP